MVKDIRGIGMAAGVELIGKGAQAQIDLFWNGMHVKFTGNCGILAPMFICEKSHIDEMMQKLTKTLDGLL